jgi:two-component system nitrogen regulation sensor histidine kinase NtrY
MTRNRYNSFLPTKLEEDRKRQKREAIIIVIIIAAVALLTFAETRVIQFGTDFPISNTILMFILINMNILLLILLIYLVFRNVVKLFYARKRKVMGAKLRTKLVVTFITLSLVPTIVLFYFSINIITTSIEFWFNVPVEQALENSLSVGRRFYSHIEDNNRFFIERTAFQIKTKNYLNSKYRKLLSRYIQIVQREFNHHAVEVYSIDSKRLTYAVAPVLDNSPFEAIDPDKLKKDMGEKKARTVSENISKGELVRTIGTIPFGVKIKDAQGFLVITTLVPPDLSEKTASISRGFEEYQQIKLLKKPIQITYYITLSIVALLVVFCAVWFGLYLAKSITIPIMQLSEGTQRVAEGDLSFNINIKADDEIGSLVDSFNKMTRDLRIGKEQLELSARMLHEQNDEIEARRQYMAIVLKNVSAGVISINARGFITTINKSAEKMLNLKPDNILKKNYKKLLKGQHLRLANEIAEKITLNGDSSVELPFYTTIKGRPRNFMMHFIALNDDVGRHMGIVMVFDDLTELQRAQRMAAWREVARRIAHEVKNPLTPISLSAQRLQRKYAKQVNNPVFEECTRTIIDHVDLIRNLVNEFARFARFPGANPQPCDLPPIIEETVALYREGHQNITFEVNVSDNIPRLNLDRQQIKQAMINLVDNAVSAINKKGKVLININFYPEEKTVQLEVADTGPGISDKEKTHLFEPYFSTKKAGMGLGLTIVSTIISDHKGVINIQDNQPQGAKFIIKFPA